MANLQISSVKVDIPDEVFADYESLAKECNELLPNVLSSALEEYIKNLGHLPPPVETVTRKLHKIKSQLNELGIEHLALFGSIARGEARRGSDIDLLINLAKGVALDWNDSGRIKRLIRDTLESNCEIELVSRPNLKPDLRKYILDEAVEIF